MGGVFRAGLYKTLDKLEHAGISKKASNAPAPPPKKCTESHRWRTGAGEFLGSGFDFDFRTAYDFDAYLVTAVAASPEARALAEKVRMRMESVKAGLAVLESEWPEDKNAYPFIVFALYKRRIDFLRCELSWLEWLENVLASSTGDVLNASWGDVNR